MAVKLDELAGPTGGKEGQRLATFWKKQLEKHDDNAQNKRWLKRGQSIEKRYRDERSRVDEDGQRRYNSLWANIEILFPALYGKVPIPIAERKFKDKDPVGRGAAQILERALRNEIEICGFDEAMQAAVKDYLLPGRGTIWVRYEPEVEEGVSIVSEGQMDIEDVQGDIEKGQDDPDADPEITKLEETGDRIIRESTPVDYISWEDFITFPTNARTWKEVTAVGKRVFMTRDQMIRRFGKIVGKYIPLKKDERGTTKYDGPDQDPEDKGEVFEIWCLTDKSVYWIAEGYEWLCDRKDDPLTLENFFPCPKPVYANSTNGTLVPVPDYIQYQDQAIQIDELTQRISMLAKACKVAGVYNAAASSIQRMFSESVENELIPVDDWAAFAEQGGVAGNISFIPLKEIMGVIQELMTVKDKTILEMDRLTGITDIMKGTTDARETLGGQRLKTNSSGTRLQRRQNEVARFARDTVRIIADIMAQHFTPKSLIEASGALYEEGLGVVDMPSMSDFQSLQQGAAQPPGFPASPGLAAPGVAPVLHPGATPPPSNVVPFRGPGGQPGVQPPTAPGMPPPMPGAPAAPTGPPGMPPGAPGAQPGMPGMDPAAMGKIIGLQRIAAAIQLLRDEKFRGFRVDIEVDSTIYSDMAQEKGDRTEFIMVVTKFLEQALMMSQQVPEIAPLMGKFLQFGVRGYKVGRDLEASIEEFCDEAVNIAKKKQMQAQQQPNPQVIDSQANMMRGQAALITAKGKNQTDQGKLQLDVQRNQSDMVSEQRQSQAEIARQQLENQGEQQNAQMDTGMKQMDMRMKELELQIEEMRMWTAAQKNMNELSKPVTGESGAA